MRYTRGNMGRSKCSCLSFLISWHAKAVSLPDYSRVRCCALCIAQLPFSSPTTVTHFVRWDASSRRKTAFTTLLVTAGHGVNAQHAVARCRKAVVDSGSLLRSGTGPGRHNHGIRKRLQRSVHHRVTVRHCCTVHSHGRASACVFCKCNPINIDRNELSRQ